MAYRDAAAARVHLAELERKLVARESGRDALRRYRDALSTEAARLRHALTWYENGERFGFNRLPERDDLSAAAPEPGAAPSRDAFDRACAVLDDEAVRARTTAVLAALARRDRRLAWLDQAIARLEAERAELRPKVEAYAARYPDHPPPPEYDPLPGLVLGGVLLLALMGGAWVIFTV